MRLYAETSAVLRWLFAEHNGEAIKAEFARASKVAASRLTLIETRRAIRRAEHDGRITSAETTDLLAIFAQAQSTWAILEILEDVPHRAEEAFPQEPVRTLDAIHLASALFLRQSLPDLAVVSTDARVVANAKLLGFLTLPHS